MTAWAPPQTSLGTLQRSPRPVTSRPLTKILTPTQPLGPSGLDTSSHAFALAKLVSSELDVGKIFTGSTTNAVARSVCSS